MRPDDSLPESRKQFMQIMCDIIHEEDSSLTNEENGDNDDDCSPISSTKRAGAS